MSLKKLWAGTCLLVVAAGCADLTVPNTNDPDRQRALSDPGALEALIGGGYRNYYLGTQRADNPAMFLAAASNEIASSAANFGMLSFYREPREPVNNAATNSEAAIIRDAWRLNYRAIAAANDGLTAMDNGVDLGDANRNARARAFARFVQGISYGVIGRLHDQAFIVDEKTDLTKPQELQPYPEVIKAALTYLDDAAKIATAPGVTFTTESKWLGFSNPMTNVQLAALARSHAARIRAQAARTPTERAAVDWAAVIADVDRSIASLGMDHMPVMDDDVFWSEYKWYTHYGPFGWWHMRYMGRADTTGAYQAWAAVPAGNRLPFDMASPDKRFPGCSQPKPSPASNNPAPAGHCSQGKYVGYRVSDRSQAVRGQQQWSNYRDFRFWDYTYNGPPASGTPVPEITAREMKLLKAEGLYRKGDLAGAAAIINESRTANGLPPVTADGVTNAAGCVPRMADGKCGSLLEALKYEKRAEIWVHTLGDWFFDSRGWGDLEPGTPLQLPVPGNDLELAGLPNYTFGGVGGPCSAGANPTGCIRSGSQAVRIPASLLAATDEPLGAPWVGKNRQ